MNKLKNKILNLLRLKILYKLRYRDSLFKSIIPNVVLKSKGSHISENVVFHNWSILKAFGHYNFIGQRAYIDYCSSIGSFCSISMDVKIGLKNHKLNLIGTSPYFYEKRKKMVNEDNLPLHKPVIIGNDVLISANAIILEGVSLGNGSVIAAGAVVSSDVPPYSIYGGVPAKLIRYRFNEGVRKKLEKIEWNDPDIFETFKSNYKELSSFYLNE